MELDYHTPEEHKLMNLKYSQEALKIIQAHLNHKPISFKEVAGTGKSQISFDKVPIKLATQYAAEDAEVTFRLYNFFRESILNNRCSVRTDF